MLVVRQGHGIVGTIAVVGAAHGGQRKRYGLGTKTIWSLFTSDDTACFYKNSAGILRSFNSDSSPHYAFGAVEILKKGERLKVFIARR